MRRKRLLLSVGLILGFVAILVACLVGMLTREPSFYKQATLADTPERKLQSLQAIAMFAKLNRSFVNNEEYWDVSFTADQLNAYFQQDYYQQGGDGNLPDGCHAPRVKIEDGKIHIGVQYGEGLFSTIMSLQIKFWLVPNQLNMLAMEIVGLQAGSLPISTGTLLDRISEAARREHIDITWYRQKGHPVAIMKFQADLTRPTFQFERVELTNGKFSIYGRNTSPISLPPPRGALPPPRVVK